MMDARLVDGSRVNAVIPPLAIDGSSLTIRKFAKERMTATDFISSRTASPTMMSFLAAAIAGRCSCIVAGNRIRQKPRCLTSFQRSYAITSVVTR